MRRTWTAAAFKRVILISCGTLDLRLTSRSQALFRNAGEVACRRRRASCASLLFVGRVAQAAGSHLQKNTPLYSVRLEMCVPGALIDLAVDI